MHESASESNQNDIRWPDHITCHHGQPYAYLHPPLWDSANDERPFRVCSYCGSIHPADLLRLLDQGAEMHGCDWKYGWPHKHYVQLDPIYTKWYNTHLIDDGYSDDAWRALTDALSTATGIVWTRNDEGVPMFSAPYPGYQR